jgi:hypothetical protein
MTPVQELDLGALRVYDPSECGDDRYPLAWHDLGDGYGVKHIVRELAGHRCVRCLHPYVCGETPGKWSPCDARCEHRGPIRWQPIDRAGIGDACGWNLDPEALAVPDTSRWRVEALQRILTVHHLRLGHDAKRDLRWWNLAALCQRCHLQIQGKVQMERVWPHEHSEWFKPYAAGWYAWSYLGLELSRSEVEDRLDSLLALELAA